MRTSTAIAIPSNELRRCAVQCGRSVHLELHVAEPQSQKEGALFEFPKDCGAKLNKGEQLLAFDLGGQAARL